MPKAKKGKKSGVRKEDSMEGMMKKNEMMMKRKEMKKKSKKMSKMKY